MFPVILITGKNGQLGQELQQLSKNFPQWQFIFTDRSDLDITNTGKVNDFFNNNNIDYCINAAAYTAVDKAETEKQAALDNNEKAVGNLAANCVVKNVQFIHISTDYVFNGQGNKPYKENDLTSPVNFYGETKLLGEQLALQTDPSTIIIRTSWVYSSFGNNFVKTMLRLTAEKESINVVDDQFGTPTNAADLAEAIFKIIVEVEDNGKNYGGIYHFSNDGHISWFNFATAINAIADHQCVVKPITSSGFPTPAKRPLYSVLNKQKIISTFNISLNYWEESLKSCIRKINEKHKNL